MKYITSKDINLIAPKIGGHKGENGRVLIIGGSKDYTGAPYLSGIAALRIGADYVAIACPKLVGISINKLTPDLITKKFDCDYFSKKQMKEVLEYSRKFDAVLIGNGLSDNKEALIFTKKIILDLIKQKKPLVIDADAIKSVKLYELKNSIITPHKGEYAILIKNSKINQKNDNKNIQKYLGTNIIIKKGPIDEILTKDKIYYNKTGCDRMAVAGTGDILAGLAVGLLAKTKNQLSAAKTAAYLSGKFGEKAKKDYGNNFIASDILKYIKKL